MTKLLPASRFVRAALAFSCAASAGAQTTPPAQLDPVVTTATRTATAPQSIGSVVDLLSGAELARRQANTLAQALGAVAGAPHFASGASGAISSLFLRGSNSNQTLFLVDGLRLNDPNTDYMVFLGGACVGACDSLEIGHGPQSTLYGGEAVGGVVSLRLAWHHPEVFGGAMCMSSTFGFQDDLFARLETEPRPPIRIYLDSGWPRDNFDATNAMRDLLVARGFTLGDDLLAFSFPEGTHQEASWADRLHVPFQFFFGRAWVAARARR
jgi:hypothetical protein